jgi:hypothetical protein
MMINNSQHSLIVDFPARRHRHQEDRQVRFAPHHKVQSVHSVLDMCSAQELWYSKCDVKSMRLEMNRDAYALARTLLSTCDKVLREGIDISQAVGLESLVDPIFRGRIQKTTILQKRAVISLQEDVLDEDELRRVSEAFSLSSVERAHTVAVHWVKMDQTCVLSTARNDSNGRER